MNLLIDTNAFLWYADGDPQLTSKAAQLITDPSNELFLSLASIWEIAIKSGIKKLKLPKNYSIYMADAIAALDLTVLPLSLDDCIAYERLPFPSKSHRDPFDRMIITQAVGNQLAVVGSDADFDAYGITRHW